MINFRAQEFSHQEVFGRLKDDMFSAQDAAEYLELSMQTFRRYVQSKKISPSKVIGRSQCYSTGDLRKLKQELRVR